MSETISLERGPQELLVRFCAKLGPECNYVIMPNDLVIVTSAFISHDMIIEELASVPINSIEGAKAIRGLFYHRNGEVQFTTFQTHGVYDQKGTALKDAIRNNYYFWAPQLN